MHDAENKERCLAEVSATRRRLTRLDALTRLLAIASLRMLVFFVRVSFIAPSRSFRPFFAVVVEMERRRAEAESASITVRRCIEH
jgi:hypothetical protein